MRSSFSKARSVAAAGVVVGLGGMRDGANAEAVAAALMNTAHFQHPTKHKRKVFVAS
jgi:hypothetical protein